MKSLFYHIIITLFLGLAILFIVAILHGKFAENIFRPDDRQTPAVKLENSIDFVPVENRKTPSSTC